MPVPERKRVTIEETDDGCTVTVWNNRQRAQAGPDKVQVFESATGARDFVVAECSGFDWGGPTP